MFFQNDVDYQSSTTVINSHWKGFYDAESPIAHYSVGLGDKRFVTNIRNMVNVGMSQGKCCVFVINIV